MTYELRCAKWAFMTTLRDAHAHLSRFINYSDAALYDLTEEVEYMMHEVSHVLTVPRRRWVELLNGHTLSSDEIGNEIKFYVKNENLGEAKATAITILAARASLHRRTAKRIEDNARRNMYGNLRHVWKKDQGYVYPNESDADELLEKCLSTKIVQGLAKELSRLMDGSR